MPTVIDSLVVTLGLKSDDFDKGTKKVEKALGDLTKRAAKFLAVLGGTYEIKKFIQSQIEASLALENLSKNLDESANSISAWSNAVEGAGGSAQGLQGTLQMLSRAQTELQLTGESRLIPYFAALGININNSAGPMGNLLDLADRFSHMNRVTANNLGNMMGIDQGTLNLLLQGRQAVETYIKRQKEFNAITDEQAAANAKLDQSLIYVRQSFTQFGREMLSVVAPALQYVFESLVKLGDWVQQHRQLVETFFIAVGGAIGTSFIPLILRLGVVILAALGPLTLFGATLALFWDDYQTWKNGGNSFFKDWGPAIEGAKTAFGQLKDVLDAVLFRAANLVAVFMAIKDGQWSIARDALKAVWQGRPEAAPGVAPGGDARQSFIASAAAKLGVPASAIDAQLRLETGATGASTVGNYNYGNIKAGSGYGGATVTKRVGEYRPYGAVQEMASFRSYGSPEEAAADYAAMIKRRFPGAVGAQTAAAFAQGLQAGGYATDPNYVAKVSSIAVGIPGAAAASGGMSYPVSNNRSSSVSVGSITIQTQATDAQGIMKDAGKSLDYLHTSQANTGLQ